MAEPGQLPPAGLNAIPDLGHGGQDGGLGLVGRQAAQTLLAGQLDVDGQAVGQQAQPPGEEGVGPRDGRGQDGGLGLVGRQAAQTLLAGQLDVDGQAVGQQAQPPGEEGVGPRDGLGVDIAVEAVLLPQQAQGFDHGLGGAVGAAPHGGGEEESLDVVAPVKADGQLRQLPGGEGRPAHVAGAAVDAVGAVVDAPVGEQHLEQGDAPAVGGEGVAASGGQGAPQAAGPARPVQPAGGARRVVLGRVGQNGQLVQQLHTAAPSPFCLASLYIKHLFQSRGG